MAVLPFLLLLPLSLIMPLVETMLAVCLGWGTRTSHVHSFPDPSTVNNSTKYFQERKWELTSLRALLLALYRGGYARVSVSRAPTPWTGRDTWNKLNHIAKRCYIAALGLTPMHVWHSLFFSICLSENPPIHGYSGKRHCVIWYTGTNVSEEPAASIIKLE
jgi:hypothetical protein